MTLGAAEYLTKPVEKEALAAAPAMALADSGSPSPSARSAAEKQCRQQRTAMGSAVFAQTYGTNQNRSNAFGKCVSHRSSQNASDEQTAQQNAAKACRAEQSDPNFAANHNGKSFDAFHGTNSHNAFGKCVSGKAKAKSAKQVHATINAAKQCRAEQQADPAAFKDHYGTNANKSNAFGKCVSGKVKHTP